MMQSDMSPNIQINFMFRHFFLLRIKINAAFCMIITVFLIGNISVAQHIQPLRNYVQKADYRTFKH